VEYESTIGNPESSAKALKDFKKRFILLKLFFALFFVAIGARLVQVQVVEAGKFQSMAKKQYEQKFVLPATRGNIFDRNGNVLVSNTVLVSFAADPKIVGENDERIADLFAKVFGRPRTAYLEKLRDNTKRFVWLERRVSPEIARRIELAKATGIVEVSEPKRLYHYDEVAGTLIGYTDVDNKGISGLEMELEEELHGKSGSVVMQRDGLGRVRPSADYPRVEPLNGLDVTLTLNLEYQALLEEELKRGVSANGADAGLALMLNPKTGEILAMAVTPGVNPNEFHSTEIGLTRNRIVSDVFEPGSVFKVVTASAAYASKAVDPTSRFFAENGEWKIALNKKQFQSIKDSHKSAWLTFEEAVAVSSNIVMAKVGKVVGPERLFTTARDFGFGVPSGIDVPGEVRGRLKKPHEWSSTTLRTMSYGYEVGATPLQIASAYGAIANRGVLMKPYVVSEVRNANGEVLQSNKPQVIRRVVAEEVAQLVTQALEHVVLNGTGTGAQVVGLRIAGKTGTSKKFRDGKYTTDEYTASFVGFFPVDDPQIVCLVMMDNPRTKGYFGGLTSAPVFKAVAERIVNTSSKFIRTPRPEFNVANANTVPVPDVRMLNVTLAQKMLASNNLKAELFGEGNVVVRQSPEPGKYLEHGDAVSLIATDPKGQPAATSIPNLVGMSLRRAVNRLVMDEYEVKIQGTGMVRQQFPPVGQKAKPGSLVILVCTPQPLVQAALY
jgi:cell division protein FtsI (penicillin-binding protein 3)